MEHMDLLPSQQEGSTNITFDETFEPYTRNINQYLQEKTVTFGVENTTAKVEELYAQSSTLKLHKHVDCIYKVETGTMILFEITEKKIEDKDQLEYTMRQTTFDFQGCRLRQFQNRGMRDIRRIPIIRVMIYEAPHELENLPILQKLTQFGKLQGQSVYRHKHRGLDIYNGARSVNTTNSHNHICKWQ